jgi:hypothetical protein
MAATSSVSSVGSWVKEELLLAAKVEMNGPD